jgi:hypothetical protein
MSFRGSDGVTMGGISPGTRPLRGRRGDKRRGGKVASIAVSIPVLAVLLVIAGCHTPRETRSVHMPLAVGNRWVYDVSADSGQGTATLDVVEYGKQGYGLSLSGEFGHLYQPDTLLYVRSRDTVLWMLNAFETNGRVWWASVLSDDPNDSCTQTLLLYRPHSGTTFSSQQVGTVVVGDDTFPDCLRLSCRRIHESWYLLVGSTDTTWVSEDYAPGVGIVRLEAEQHWSEWMGYPVNSSSSGTWVERWELREFSVAQ